MLTQEVKGQQETVAFKSLKNKSTQIMVKVLIVKKKEIDLVFLVSLASEIYRFFFLFSFSSVVSSQVICPSATVYSAARLTLQA